MVIETDCNLLLIQLLLSKYTNNITTMALNTYYMTLSRAQRREFARKLMITKDYLHQLAHGRPMTLAMTMAMKIT